MRKKSLRQSIFKFLSLLNSVMAEIMAEIAVVEVIKIVLGYIENVQPVYDLISGLKPFEEQVRQCFLQLSANLARTEQNLGTAMRSAHVHTQYAEHETTIRTALQCHQNYLKKPNSYWKEQYIKHGEPLRIAARTLMEGLLGERTFGFDIIQTISDDENVKGRPGKLRMRLNRIVALVNIAICLHAVYVNLSKISAKDNAPTAQTLADLYNAATRRIEDEIEKREREDNAHQEILQVLNDKGPAAMFGKADCKKLAKAVYNVLTERYDTRQWLVIVWEEGSKHSYHYQDVTFGGRFHWVKYISSGLSQDNTISAFATSFSLDPALNPVDFFAPAEIPNRSIESFRPLLGSLAHHIKPNIPQWKRESAGLLVKVLNEMEPRNHYLVLRNGVKDLRNGFYCRQLPEVMPINSPLVKELLVGDNLKVIAFPKEVPNDYNNWEDNVHHKMVSWMEEHERSDHSKDREALANTLYEYLSSCYIFRRWIVIVHTPVNGHRLTFGTRYHYVTIPSGQSALAISFPNEQFQTTPVDFTLPDEIPKVTSGQSALAISFPNEIDFLSQFDFTLPDEIPKVTAEMVGMNATFFNLSPTWRKESADLLVKALNKREPRNNYFVTTLGKGTSAIGSPIERHLPNLMPKNSPLVKEVGNVGENLHVFALPKENI